MQNPISVILSLTLVFIFSFSCKDSVQEDSSTEVVIPDSLETQAKIEEAKEIFYSMPAPHEVATFLMSGKETNFDKSILNPASNMSLYSTEVSQAFNLGIYSADLSYSSLFDQNQVVIDYMVISKKLAMQLNILNAFDEETIELLEANVNNRDEIMRIISETLLNSDAYLQENDRQDIGAMVLIGGWIEGMYLAAKISGGLVSGNTSLVSSILEQQLSLDLMVQFLRDFQSPKLDIVRKDLGNLFEFYTKIKTTVTDDGYLMCTQEEFDNLCQLIIEIRGKIVNLP